MLFGVIDLDIASSVFVIAFIILAALNMFVFPKVFMINRRVFKGPDKIVKDEDSLETRTLIVQVTGSKSAQYINKAVIVYKGLNCYLRPILAQDLQSIRYEVTMYDEKNDDEYVPFKTITIDQQTIDGGELDLVRLSERTKTVQINVIKANNEKVNKQNIRTTDMLKYAFTAAIAIIPATFAVIAFFLAGFAGDVSSLMVMWSKNYEQTISIAAIIVPIIAYIATVPIILFITRAIFRPQFKQKGVKTNGN